MLMSAPRLNAETVLRSENIKTIENSARISLDKFPIRQIPHQSQVCFEKIVLR